jgi:hypothetical protein
LNARDRDGPGARWRPIPGPQSATPLHPLHDDAACAILHRSEIALLSLALNTRAANVEIKVKV